MSFQDEISHDLDVVAYHSIRHLQLYVSTVCCLASDDTAKVLDGLSSIVQYNDWGKYLEYEEVLGINILKRIEDIKGDE